MSQQTITIRSATEADIPAIVDLIVTQQMRQCSRDLHLPQGQTRVQRATALTERSQQDALVALNREGRVCSYAHPGVWDLKPDSLLRAFLTARNGIVSTLTFPDPAEEDAETVVRAMVSALDQYWQQAGTTGDLLRWPSIDGWLQAPLAEQGFQLDSICALRPRTPFFAQRPAPGPLQRVRMARPEDEEILVKLFEEELLFHERYTPFVRSSPGVLAAFRRKLKEMWEGDALDVLEAGAPVVLVVEQEQTVVAMAENTLLSVTLGDAPGYTPAGCYWCLDNVSVREPFQGQGIGRLLVQAVEDVREELGLLLDGYILWYNPDNPRAARFWPRLGFHPLWTTFQRLNPATNANQES